MKKRIALLLLAILLCSVSICILVWGVLPSSRARLRQTLPPVVFPTPTRVEWIIPDGLV